MRGSFQSVCMIDKNVIWRHTYSTEHISYSNKKKKNNIERNGIFHDFGHCMHIFICSERHTKRTKLMLNDPFTYGPNFIFYSAVDRSSGDTKSRQKNSIAFICIYKILFGSSAVWFVIGFSCMLSFLTSKPNPFLAI